MINQWQALTGVRLGSQIAASSETINSQESLKGVLALDDSNIQIRSLFTVIKVLGPEATFMEA